MENTNGPEEVIEQDDMKSCVNKNILKVLTEIYSICTNKKKTNHRFSYFIKSKLSLATVQDL